MARLIVIGSGAMGLAAAYHASKAGHSVQVLEAAADPGGMAAHFDFDGLSIERFYHFVCKADRPTFALLKRTRHRRSYALAHDLDGLFHRRTAPSVGRPHLVAALSADQRYFQNSIRAVRVRIDKAGAVGRDRNRVRAFLDHALVRQRSL